MFIEKFWVWEVGCWLGCIIFLFWRKCLRWGVVCCIVVIIVRKWRGIFLRRERRYGWGIIWLRGGKLLWIKVGGCCLRMRGMGGWFLGSCGGNWWRRWKLGRVWLLKGLLGIVKWCRGLGLGLRMLWGGKGSGNIRLRLSYWSEVVEKGGVVRVGWEIFFL